MREPDPRHRRPQDRVRPGEPRQICRFPQGVDPCPQLCEVDGLDGCHPGLERVVGKEARQRDRYAYGAFGRIGRRLQLYLSGVVIRGQEVVVSYSDPTPGDDYVALQDLAGNDMASFTATATNNTAVEPVPALPLAGLGLLGVLLVLLGRRRQGG